MVGDLCYLCGVVWMILTTYFLIFSNDEEMFFYAVGGSDGDGDADWLWR